MNQKYFYLLVLLSLHSTNRHFLSSSTRLYAPWRSDYVHNKLQNNSKQLIKKKCPFCEQLSEKKDAQNYIIKRFKYCALFLNPYPYNLGHLMIIPYRHVSKLYDLSKDERTEIMEITSLCTLYFEKFLKAAGANIGINLGKVAGAGIPEHIHIHLLPRNLGDIGFLQTIANTVIVDIDLPHFYKKITDDFSQLTQ